jgi:hypothetical protein
VNRAAILSAANRHLLESYSRRTTAVLQAALPLPIALPWLERLLAENVAKEVRKNSLVIARADATVDAGEQPDEAMVEALLAAARDIDRNFLAGMGGVPLVIRIPYERIEPIRRRRIERLLDASIRILRAWQGRYRLRAVLDQTCPGVELERLLFDLLNLYAEETRVLGEAVRLPRLLVPLRQRVVGSLYRVMQDAAGQLAMETAARALSGRATAR